MDGSGPDRTVSAQSDDAGDTMATVSSNPGFAGVCLWTCCVGTMAGNARRKDDDRPRDVGFCVGQFYLWPGGDIVFRKEDSNGGISNKTNNVKI